MGVPVAEAFGREFADELASWAMDVLMGSSVPLKGKAACAQVPWSEINRGREILERRGIDWREIAGGQIKRRREFEREQSRLHREAYAAQQRAEGRIP